MLTKNKRVLDIAFVFAGSCRLWSPSRRSSSCCQSKGANSARICGQAWQSTARRRRNAGDVSFWSHDSRARVSWPMMFCRYRRRCSAWARYKKPDACRTASLRERLSSNPNQTYSWVFWNGGMQGVKRICHTYLLQGHTCSFFLSCAATFIHKTAWSWNSGSFMKLRLSADTCEILLISTCDLKNILGSFNQSVTIDGGNPNHMDRHW